MKSLVLKVAAKARHKHHVHVAIVTRGGAIVAIGYNHEEVHAEDMALSKLWPSERIGTKLYSIRVRPGGKYGMAKPCDDCMKLIESSGVKQVFYSTDTGMVRIKVAR